MKTINSKKNNEVCNKQITRMIWKGENIRQESFEDKYIKNKKYCKTRDHCNYTVEYRVGAHNICNLKYIIPKEITVIFYNGSNYDYHCITEELAEELNGQFTCLEEKTEKYITFSTAIKKEVSRIT